MATILNGVSRTFAEYLLIPRLTRKDQSIERVNLSSPLSATERGNPSRFRINTPIVAAMQSVSGPRWLQHYASLQGSWIHILFSGYREPGGNGPSG